MQKENQENGASHCAGVHLSTLFVATFFETLNREWEGVDQYRLDKIYSLVRKVLFQIYKYFDRRSFHHGVIAQFNDVLVSEVLEKTPNGMRYHLIDIALEELAKVNCDLETDVFVNVIEPFFGLAMAETDKVVLNKVFNNIFLKFLVKYSTVKDEEEKEEHDNDGEGEEEEDSTFANVDVRKLAKLFFEMGKSSDTLDPNRTKLYEMKKTYVKRISRREREGKLLPRRMNNEQHEMEVEAGNQWSVSAPAEREAEGGRGQPAPIPPEATAKTRKRKAQKIDKIAQSSPKASQMPKQVSFGKNRAKSYVKSMKDLQSKDIIISPKPKRGVLNTKLTPSLVAEPKKLKKKSMKRQR